MKILELRHITREDEGLYYRRKFNACVAVEIPAKVLEIPVNFTIEMGPLGNKELYLEFLEAPDYPLIPIRQALMKQIMSMDSEGTLP